MDSIVHDILSHLEKRFGAHRVSVIPAKNEEDIDLIRLDLELRFPVTVVMTYRLSNYKMEVPENFKERSFNEIYFCLPSYWDWNALEDEKFSWPFKWIQKLAKHVVEKNTWYGPGHTFANGNPPESLSSSMKPNHLMLVDPILLEDYLQPIETPEKKVHFLGITPLFEREFDQKNSKGYHKFIRKYRNANGNELVDDFRESVLKKRFRLF